MMLNELDAKMLSWATNRFGQVQTDDDGRPTTVGLDREQRKEYQEYRLHLMRQIDSASRKVDRPR